jgi:DNA-binding response OmpR family regulator
MAEKKILLVDYDTQSLDTLAKLLKSKKLQILRATDGQSAYEMFGTEKPDLVILEAILPKMHGFDLTKKISQESNGQVPVIIVTGLYRGPQYRHEAINSCGATEFFEKPVDTERFVSVVKQLLHDEDDIEDELPDSNAVLESLSKIVSKIMGRKSSESRADAPEDKGNQE